MTFENSLKRGVLFGFVPKTLEIKERPELNVFPFNVLFMNFKQENGKRISGTAIYEPDLASFQKDTDKWSMCYYNVYSRKDWLLIEYDIVKKSYFGEKFVNGKSVGMADGSKWNGFFMHFTALGLSNGEQCKFETVDLP
ncbi:hypothetical protein KJ684_00390 [Patescibacteria group bacterium]|nr:hypothetical protein [Patescibacteria group bacterium]